MDTFMAQKYFNKYVKGRKLIFFHMVKGNTMELLMNRPEYECLQLYPNSLFTQIK